jgi:hypothetical protein
MGRKGKGKMVYAPQAMVIDLEPSSLYIATEEPSDESQRFQWCIITTDGHNIAKRYQWQIVRDGPFAERYTEEYCGTVMNVNYTRAVLGYFKVMGYIHADERLLARLCENAFLDSPYGQPTVAENRLLNLSSRTWVLNVLSGLSREGYIVGRRSSAGQVAREIVWNIGNQSERLLSRFIHLVENLGQMYETPVIVV